MSEKIYDIIIIGGGAAGLTAAIYARRANKSVLVLESTVFGGQIINTTTIENYPVAPNITGSDFASTLYQQAESFDADFEYAEVSAVKKSDKLFSVETDAGNFAGRTVIIAAGTTNRPLGLANEARLTGHGVSYCATCDGALFKGQPVAVFGGGNTALNDALYLADLASHVFLIHRRDQFRGDEILADRVRANQNIECVLECNVTALEEQDGKLKAIEITNKNTGEKRIEEVSAIFVAIGRTPNTAAFKDLVKLDDQGYIIADANCRTSVEGVFSAGDINQKVLRQLVTATSDGAIAASSAIDYLNQQT